MNRLTSSRIARTLIASTALTLLSLGAPAALAVGVQSVTFPGPDGVTLNGVLYTPDDYAVAPTYAHRAVVMLHGCSGMWSNREPFATNGSGTPNLQNQVEKWGLKLAGSGFVALAVDSYTPREPSTLDKTVLAQRKEWQNQCSGATNAGKVDPYTTRVLDARAAYAYLVADTRVDALRVGMLGWSQGAESAMIEAADSGRATALPLRPASELRFATTVVFYPGCGSALGFGAPTTGFWSPYADFRLNVGDLDGFYTNCEARVSDAITTASSEVVFAGYDGAAHSFDGVSQSWPSAVCPGSAPTGDTCAMNDADINSLAFFQTYL